MRFTSRRDGGPDRWLHVKTGLFVIAAILGIAGMSMGASRIVAAALGFAIAGFLLRFARRS